MEMGGASDGQRMMELHGGWVGSAFGAGGKVLERDKAMVIHVKLDLITQDRASEAFSRRNQPTALYSANPRRRQF